MNVQASYGVTRNRTATTIGLIASCMIVAMLAGQLFGYEDFSMALSLVMTTNDAQLLGVIAAAIVIAELMALPFLLAMYISKLMRAMSAMLGFAVAGFWLLISLTNAHVENSAMFSSSLVLPGGIVAMIWALLLFVCVSRIILTDSRLAHVSS